MTDVVIDEATGTRRTALGTLLIERGLLDQQRLDEALAVAEESGKRLGEVLVRLGWASEEDIAKTLADQWQLRYFERSAISFDSKALRRMSHEDAERLEALPIRDGDDGLVVAVAEPTEARLLALRELLGDRIDFVVVVKSAIETCLKSALLSRSGGALDPRGGQFASQNPIGDAEPRPVRAAREQFEAEATAEEAEAAVDEQPDEEDVVAENPSGASFDGLAGLLADARVQLEELRSVVETAEATRKRDRRTIEALRSELAQRTAELEERNGTIRELQQTLQDVASRLGSIGVKS